jgi:ATP-binding cassette subfamily B protein
MSSTKRGDLSKYDINYRYNLKTYFSFVKKHPGLLTISIVAVILVEILASADRFLFKEIIDKGTAFSSSAISREVFMAFLVALAFLYLGISVGRVVSRWMRTHLLNRLHAILERDLKQRYFNHIVGLSHGFHTTHKTGSFISRIGRGASAMDRMTEFFMINVLPLIVQFIIVVVSVSYFDKSTVIVIVAMSAVFIAYSSILQKLQKPATIANNQAEDTEKGNLADFFTNIDSIKYFGREQYIGQRYQALISKTHDTDVKRADYQRWMRSGHMFVLALGTFLVFYFPLQGFVEGKITLGTIALIYALYGGLMPYLGFFVDGLRGFYRSMEDFNDLFEYGKIENDIKDKPQAADLDIREGNIEFRNVDFSYQKRKILKNFSLKIPKDKKIALVGHSGSGKTTLVKLLYRLYDVDKGEILIDGKDVKEFKQQSLRSELSIVPQECVLFDDTIYNNIAFSNPNASKAEVWKAIRFAQLDKIIAMFPHKENTIVGERGVRLSGGEKQRVSIARALLANKKVLVLDEATSSLDSQTEHDIQQDLQKLMKGKTSIIIAHRLSTIMGADLIVVLDKGKIVQKGTHRELIKQQGTYKQLWNLQKGGYLAEDNED